MARRGDRPPIGISWLVTWPLSAVFAALVFLSAEEARQPAREVAPPVARDPEWAAHFPQRIAAVDAALRKGPVRLPQPVEEERGSGPLRWTYRRYDVELKRADQAHAEATIQAVRDTDPGLVVTAENTADGTEVRLGLDGLLISTVRFLWREQPKARPRLAVVVGPLGDDLRVARQVIDLDGPVVLGVRPFRPFSQQVAALGHMFDREVIVQFDGSEPGATPVADGGAGTSAARGLDAALATVPDAVGVSWPAGAKSPPNKSLLAEIDRRQLLFVGDRGGKVSQPSALPAPSVLVDTEAQPDALNLQLAALAAKAQQDGSAIAVASPTDATLTGLRQSLPEWRAADIDVVPVSALAAPASLSAR